MIHSLACGLLGEVEYCDYAKVEITEGGSKGSIFWYKSTLPKLKPDDKVLVPLGINNTQTAARVIRIDHNVSSQNSPVPSKRAKYVTKIIK